MKNLSILIFSFFFSSFLAFAQESYIPETISSEVSTAEMSSAETTSEKTMTTELTVVINGLGSDKGTLMIAVYGSSKQWLSKSQFSKSTAIVNGTATVVFEDIPTGTYGISTYHDENDNKKLDTRIFGIPKEPYASSRGAKGRFGPPQWTDAKFDLSKTSHTEEIKY